MRFLDSEGGLCFSTSIVGQTGSQGPPGDNQRKCLFALGRVEADSDRKVDVNLSTMPLTTDSELWSSCSFCLYVELTLRQ